MDPTRVLDRSQGPTPEQEVVTMLALELNATLATIIPNLQIVERELAALKAKESAFGPLRDAQRATSKVSLMIRRALFDGALTPRTEAPRAVAAIERPRGDKPAPRSQPQPST
jgi:hypothetical protein